MNRHRSRITESLGLSAIGERLVLEEIDLDDERISDAKQYPCHERGFFIVGHDTGHVYGGGTNSRAYAQQIQERAEEDRIDLPDGCRLYKVTVQRVAIESVDVFVVAAIGDEEAAKSRAIVVVQDGVGVDPGDPTCEGLLGDWEVVSSSDDNLEAVEVT